jgi:Ran GTPase-activating protein (RanGAP) involved in mRNA processing and transport
MPDEDLKKTRGEAEIELYDPDSTTEEESGDLVAMMEGSQSGEVKEFAPPAPGLNLAAEYAAASEWEAQIKVNKAALWRAAQLQYNEAAAMGSADEEDEDDGACEPEFLDAEVAELYQFLTCDDVPHGDKVQYVKNAIGGSTSFAFYIANFGRENAACAIVEALAGNETLTDLSFVGSDQDEYIGLIEDEQDNFYESFILGIKMIMGALKTHPALKRFDFSYCDYIELASEGLADLLEGNTALTEIYLRGTPVTKTYFLKLADALVKNKTLTKLDLENAALTDKDCEVIARLLRANETLICINLSKAYASRRGVKMIIEALKTNYHLVSLDLSNIELPQEDLDEVEKYLFRNSQFARLLMGDSSIIELDLTGVHLKDEGFKLVVQLLRNNNKALTKLNLSETDISREGTQALIGVLETNHHIISLRLEGIVLTPSDSHKIEAYLARNQKIWLEKNSSHNAEAQNFWVSKMEEGVADQEMREVVAASEAARGGAGMYAVRVGGLTWQSEANVGDQKEMELGGSKTTNIAEPGSTRSSDVEELSKQLYRSELGLL